MEKDRERAPRGAKRTRKKVCQFCADRVEKIDYKDTAKLRKCMTCLLYTSPSPRDCS